LNKAGGEFKQDGQDLQDKIGKNLLAFQPNDLPFDGRQVRLPASIFHPENPVHPV
jgi:hypothetical protein